MALSSLHLLVPLVLLLAWAWYRSPSSPPVTSLQNKAVLITGSSSGIGEELAYQLANAGARLCLVARSVDKLQKVKENALQQGSPHVHIIPFNLENVDNCGDVVSQCVETLGGIDFAVFNHAAMPSVAPFLALRDSHDPQYIEKIFKVNVFSHIQLTLAALPHLEKSSGHIIVTSSVGGERPIYSMGLYASSKHGLNGFFYSLQQELLVRQSNVSLTVASLGFILTKNYQELFARHDISYRQGLAAGNLTETGSAMLQSLLSRPRTLTYPLVYGNLDRFMFYFYPWHAEWMIGRIGSYEDVVARVNTIVDHAKQLSFQDGYLVHS